MKDKIPKEDYEDDLTEEELELILRIESAPQQTPEKPHTLQVRDDKYALQEGFDLYEGIDNEKKDPLGYQIN